jgi:hypothetical protein
MERMAVAPFSPVEGPNLFLFFYKKLPAAVRTQHYAIGID